MTLGRPGRLLAIALTLAFLAGGAVMTVRWLLGPDHLAQVIGGWVERELDARLSLGQPPGIRLVPRLKLTLDDIGIERDGQPLAAIDQLSLALPWSALWRDGLHVESLMLRGPRVTWPALAELLAGFSDDQGTERTPTLPRIAVGIRVENGTIVADLDQQPWRIDRISLVTTPLRSGRDFHLDAGARLHGSQVRTISLTASTRPVQANDRLQLDQLATRLIISPDNQPPAADAAITLNGRVHLASAGIALIDLDGQLPGWPDWAPALPGFLADTAIAVSARQPQPAAPLAISLQQPATPAQPAPATPDTGARSLAIVLQPDSLNQAIALRDQPLQAIAALRLQASMNQLDIGAVQLHGLRLELGTGPDAADTGPDTDAADDRGHADIDIDMEAGPGQP